MRNTREYPVTVAEVKRALVTARQVPTHNQQFGSIEPYALRLLGDFIDSLPQGMLEDFLKDKG